MKATAKTCPNPNVCDLVYYPVVEFWVIHQDVLDAIGNICQKQNCVALNRRTRTTKIIVAVTAMGAIFQCQINVKGATKSCNWWLAPSNELTSIEAMLVWLMKGKM